MNLFSMTESDIQRMVDAHDARLYDIHFGTDDLEPCCKVCKYHAGSDCCLSDWDDSVPDYKTVDDDDWCEQFRIMED